MILLTFVQGHVLRITKIERTECVSAHFVESQTGHSPIPFRFGSVYPKGRHLLQNPKVEFQHKTMVLQ